LRRIPITQLDEDCSEDVADDGEELYRTQTPFNSIRRRLVNSKVNGLEHF